jgi:transcriptional regulator with XRE-family HTH domain
MISKSATAAIGKRIRRLREAKGLSRTDLARTINVDVSSIAGWEGGKRLPRDQVRPRLALALDSELALLMSPQVEPDTLSTVAVLDVASEFPHALAAAARAMRRSLRAVRLSAPEATALHVMREAGRSSTTGS